MRRGTSSRSIPSRFGSATARSVTSTAPGTPSPAGTAAGRFGEPRASRRRSSWNIWKRSSPSRSGRSKSTGDRSSRNTSRRPAGIEESACSSSPHNLLSCRVMSRGRTERIEKSFMKWKRSRSCSRVTIDSWRNGTESIITSGRISP